MEISADAARRGVLLAGIARSGTTWIANGLSRCAGASLVHEPDNDLHHPHAMAAKARLGRYPVLRPGDRAPGYAGLFAAAFTDPGPDPVGRRRRALARRLVGEDPDPVAVARVMGQGDVSWPWRLRTAALVTRAPAPGGAPPGPRIVKTVHAPLAADWLFSTLRPAAAFVVVRHPANVVGSWQDLGWDMRTLPWSSEAMWEAYGPPEGAPAPADLEDQLTRSAWAFALVAHALVLAAERHGLRVVDHEDVLADPVSRLAELAGSLGLEWTDEAAAWVHHQDQPGTGYELQRVAAEERGRWRSRLPDAELRRVADVVSRFPLLRDRWDLTPAGSAGPDRPPPSR